MPRKSGKALKDPKLKIRLIPSNSVNAYGASGNDGVTMGQHQRDTIYIAANEPSIAVIAREELPRHVSNSFIRTATPRLTATRTTRGRRP